MAIQRAVVKGLITGGVQTRSVFTADVVTAGGDTAQLLWEVYLIAFWSDIIQMVTNRFETLSYELLIPNAGQWELFDEVTFAYSGMLTGEQIANAVALVLIGKAAGIRHVGRKFISPLSESSALGNELAAGYLTTAASALLNYISPVNGIGGGTLTPGVVDKLGNFHGFVGGAVSSILGSIRRRKPGRGI